MRNEKTLKEIRKVVEQEFNLNINKKIRSNEYVYARAVYYKLCKVITQAPLADIGKTLNKNHATVLHGIRIFDSFLIQKVFYKTELSIYKKILDVYTEDKEKNPSTLIEKIKAEKLKLSKEKQEVIKIYQDINNKYLELKRKHNHMLKFFCKYEPNAYDKYAEI